ncbi:hypothetical protein J31TS4_31220 [Paenibacillus sp. J31TS4]|uniref:MrcB family domain-containing protein n=1 Tax=Paenibacillus sp. J31TS4 TaxID=2807195 RepID=UPI001B172A96|nr:DUF3578 domain-containing protein [Paenibacillus sp. J31TS4]GIP39842.1 hypothetical protein J31TS4_31220 [Paenibacillus sp. J31TS4]
MSLPIELSSIFRNKQKSYKMVLILSMIDEYRETQRPSMPFSQVAERFLSYFRKNDEESHPIDEPPTGLAPNWAQFSLSQTKSLLKTPMDALSAILAWNSQQQTLSFKPAIWNSLDEEGIEELRQYALTELEQYNSQLLTGFSLQQTLAQVMDTYLEAKREPLTNHPLGTLFRQVLPRELMKLPFLDDSYKIQGSIGQGNWATIPWIAILDKRLTHTTQHGEYIVYLFAEDMSRVYLTLNQGVTLPLRDRGRKEGYQYLEQKVREMRDVLPLDDMQKDDNIQLTSSGLGRDYQVSTVAYICYEKGKLPDNDQLLADLENMMTNYKLYADELQRDKEPEGKPTFKYTMAHLHLGHGVLAYLTNMHPSLVPLDELVAHSSEVLYSGDQVKNPRDRIQLVARAMHELGLLSFQEEGLGLTSLGVAYVEAFESNLWLLSPQQAELLRKQIDQADRHSTNLLQVLQSAASIAQELGSFSMEQFCSHFVPAMDLQEQWGQVTQESRSRFMLNWLQQLRYISKSGDLYSFQQEEREDVEELSVQERLKAIKSYIQLRGFHYPGSLIENLYLSLKTKPFVILAGVSGTGKTKLIKLFAEALGATSQNRQFTLIPVRPDWSDPSDLLGYKDLAGVFRPGQLAEVLVEAAKPGNRHRPYFVCLDEMNLARVEHYFSDLLSIIETTEWRQGRIVTSPLIQGESLGETDRQVYGDLSLPDNVYLVGTVNMDETTHPFSKKVLDRANTIEFNYINLQQYPSGEVSERAEPVRAVSNSFLRSEYLQLIDGYQDYQELVHKTTEKLVKINSILEQIHAHVGFRIRDAICFYMIYNQRFQLLDEDEAFDLQLLQKLLPRVQGSNQSVKRVLLQLMQGALGKSLSINELLEDASELYQKWTGANSQEAKYPQSARKIAFMLRRLEEDGYTSYWLS